MAFQPGDTATNPTIFLRLNSADTAPRELAWNEFEIRYAPMIRAFARWRGAKPGDSDDVVQDVMLGFFLRSPTFVYDPNKGRFRSYLMSCAERALRKRLGKDARYNGRPLDEIDPHAIASEQAWRDFWEQELLASALEQFRARLGKTKLFQAFERYVIREEPPQAIADALGMHLNSVYRAKDKVTRLLRAKLVKLREED